MTVGNTFGIKGTNHFQKTYYWVGEDFRLFDWLKSEETEPSGLPYRAEKMRIVRPPEGYAFRYGSSLLALDSETTEALNGEGLSSRGYVTAKSPRDDKASMIYSHLKKVTQAEFEAMNFDEYSVLDFEIY
jgi:hypothetical protein